MKKSMQILFILGFAAIVLTACNDTTRMTETESTTITTDTQNRVGDKADTDTTGPIGTEYTVFPIDSHLSAQVLTVGKFHRDEVRRNADKQKWYGLFQNKSGFYLAQTSLRLTRVHDPVLDGNENEKTGWNVQTSINDSAIILIEQLDYLSTRKVEQAVLSKNQLLPGDTLRIKYSGLDYTIYATGDKKRIQNTTEEFEVTNYKLYLTASIKGQHRQSLLVAHPNFDDQMITLIFAGDIDGDGILDLIIDTSRHYNARKPTIYFSKPAKNGEIVKPIGAHTSVGG